MIHPDLATMLAVVTTDYPLEPGEAIDFLRPAVDASFNSISVDGECSTNDAVVLLSSGAAADRAHAGERRRIRSSRCSKVCADLSQQIVADGEGATLVAEIAVTGAATRRRGEGDRAAHRDLAARQDGALRSRRELGPRADGRRQRAVQRRLRAARRRRAISLAYNGTPVLDRGHAAGRRAATVDGAVLHDRARARPRRRQRRLPDERPLVRLRADQRGVPLVSARSS